MKCPQCGYTVRKGNFCPNCGTKFLRAKYCRNCEEIIDANAEVCPFCNASQQSPAPVFQWWYALVLAGVLLVGIAAGIGIHMAVSAQALPQDTGASLPSLQVDPNPDYEVTYQRDWVYRDVLDDVCCYALVEVENTGNVNLRLGRGQFQFRSPQGEKITTYHGVSSFPSIIAPGEKGYFYCNMGALKDMDENTPYVMTPQLTLEETSQDPHSYPVAGVEKVSGDLFAPWHLDGWVKNDSQELLETLQVDCLIFDEESKPLAVCGAMLQEVKAGESARFAVSSVLLGDMDLTLEDVKEFQFFAYDPSAGK
ncbi:double zinc ribbon domain-containing protein [Acutalibacter intestini]|uniref:double zinc ribbon domain-containing protein n=1 Tax=Acutalibacter intestini TaxID=3093659 RepID=UPI002AC9611A|nr:zinc ribbon domain-containing protein [Acutalibacter sp. M00204]